MPGRERGGLTGVPRARKGGCDGRYVEWEGAQAGGVAPAGHRHETRRVKIVVRPPPMTGRWQRGERRNEHRAPTGAGGGNGWHRQMTPGTGDGQPKEGEASRTSAEQVDGPQRSPRRLPRHGQREARGSRAQRITRAVDRAAHRQWQTPWRMVAPRRQGRPHFAPRTPWAAPGRPRHRARTARPPRPEGGKTAWNPSACDFPRLRMPHAHREALTPDPRVPCPPCEPLQDFW